MISENASFCAVPSRAATKVHLPALAAVLLGVSIVTLDISLTSTAVPAIARGIGAEPASSIWIINIYYLAVVAVLCLWGPWVRSMATALCFWLAWRCLLQALWSVPWQTPCLC